MTSHLSSPGPVLSFAVHTTVFGAQKAEMTAHQQGTRERRARQHGPGHGRRQLNFSRASIRHQNQAVCSGRHNRIVELFLGAVFLVMLVACAFHLTSANERHDP